MTAPSDVITILAVDDHSLLRGGIAALLVSEADMRLVGEAANGTEALEQFRALRPDVALMDLQMANGGGIDAIIAIRREFPDARIIVLTTYPGDALAQRALKAGAQAYLLKSLVRKELLDTIRSVYSGKKHISPDVASEMAQHAADESLTAREIEVLKLVAAGNTNKQIAFLLSISDDTAKGHVKNILYKLDVNDRTQAAMLALKRGIIGV
jgi:DNA-binding NarL/FixJ family response regulator